MTTRGWGILKTIQANSKGGKKSRLNENLTMEDTMLGTIISFVSRLFFPTGVPASEIGVRHMLS